MAFSAFFRRTEHHLTDAEKLQKSGISTEAIAGLAVFVCLLTFIPIIYGLIIRRRRRRRMFAPPKQRLDARKKLDTVTISSASEENGDRKSSCQSQDSECAICLNELFYQGSENPRSPTSQTASSAINILDRLQAGEVLTLKRCHHSFHASCLTSWYLLERHDCPVCRVDYFKGGEDAKKEGWKRFLPFRKQGDEAPPREIAACGT
ncbi:hypothetical protein BGZ60DRAFT_230997 [Tricladium varicosporioides]|nr:hypothetical protein BGZ60DRAFT_230997 [Hymenoscyphus varicosporioides]